MAEFQIYSRVNLGTLNETSRLVAQIKFDYAGTETSLYRQ